MHIPSMKELVTPEEWQLRCDLAACYRLVALYGMSDKFGMVALETNTNAYLGGDAQLACSGDTAARVDDEVMRLIKEAYDSALAILKQNTAKLHDLAEYLLEKENISGEEFQRILSQQDEKITPLPAGGETAV